MFRPFKAQLTNSPVQHRTWKIGVCIIILNKIIFFLYDDNKSFNYSTFIILFIDDEKPAAGLVSRAKPNDKWEGEDEDDDVKDNWDDEEEEASKETEQSAQSKPSTGGGGGGKKKLAKKIAEKEAKLREKLESKQNPMTPEEILADKLARQRLQEESDLRVTVESFGISSPAGGSTALDLNVLASKEDFDSFRKNLVEKLVPVERSPHYVSFLETLCRELCTSLDPEDIKRISSALSILSNEKIKASKGTKKKAKKGAAIKVDSWQETAYGDLSDGDYADFM